MILSQFPKLSFLANNGRPLVGGKLFTYEAGTSTKTSTYQDFAGVAINTNPIVLDYRGEANVWLRPNESYKFVLAPPDDTDPPTNPFWSVDNISPLGGGQSVGQVLWPQTIEEGSNGITVIDYTYPPRWMERYGIVTDGVTDNAALILSIGNAMGGVLRVPFNAYYDRSTVVASLDSDCLLQDLSQVNNFNSAGETTKRLGILAKDAATSDSQWAIDSGHFAVLALNNFGSAGGASATAKRVAVFWAAGQYSLGGVGKEGDRPCAQLVFGKDSGGNYWTMRLEAYAPWLAIAGAYERWGAGQTITAGMYRVTSAPRIYVANTSGGPTTATEPTVTSGTQVVDGITWQYVDEGQHTIYSIDQYQRVLIGQGGGTDSFLHKTSPNDPAGGIYKMMLQASGVSQNVEMRWQPTDGAAANTAQPYLRVQDGVGLRFLDSAITWEMIRMHNTELLSFRAGFSIFPATITYSASMTPDSRNSNSQTITATNGVAFTINAPSNPQTGRRLKLTIRNTSGGALGAATWNAAYKMSAWTQPANGFSRSIEFEYDGANWIQINQTGVDVTN